MQKIKDILENSTELESGRYIITDANAQVEIHVGNTRLLIKREHFEGSCFINTFVMLRERAGDTSVSSTWTDAEYVGYEQTDATVPPVQK